MIDVSLRARIRRLYFAEHWRVGTIVRQLRLHPDTVRRAIESERFAPRPRQVRPSILDPYKELIEKTLEQYPKLRATRLFEMLRTRGYPGSAVQLRRYVRTVRPKAKREAYLRLKTLPGEQAQVDWGHFGKLTIGAARRPLCCFVLVLGYSRALFARFFLDAKMESFLRGHVEAFETLGGVSRTLLYDNLKSVVVERDGDHIRFHPHILELAGHYHFAPKVCAPYRGNEKGKVERAIQYLRHSFFAARRFSSLADLNRQLRRWTEEVAHARPVPGDPERRPVRDVLAEERERLLPLPEHGFSTEQVQPVASGKTPYIRFDKNDYSIPHELTGKPLTLVASESEIRIVNSGGRVLAQHLRSYDRGQVVEDPAHLAGLAKKKRHARELRGRARLENACKNAHAFFDSLLARDQPLRTHAAQLIRLLDRYNAVELDEALAEALDRGAVSAASVAHILDRRTAARGAPPPLAFSLPDDPRVRDLRVTPHALGDYDALAKPDDQEAPDDQTR